MVDSRYWRQVTPMPQDVVLRPSSQPRAPSYTRCDMIFDDQPARCKLYMADAEYSHHLLYLPQAVVLERLPFGLPAGCNFHRLVMS